MSLRLRVVIARFFILATYRRGTGGTCGGRTCSRGSGRRFSDSCGGGGRGGGRSCGSSFLGCPFLGGLFLGGPFRGGLFLGGGLFGFLGGLSSFLFALPSVPRAASLRAVFETKFCAFAC